MRVRHGERAEQRRHEIGRASCRGRGEISVGAVSLKKKKAKLESLSRVKLEILGERKGLGVVWERTTLRIRARRRVRGERSRVCEDRLWSLDADSRAVV